MFPAVGSPPICTLRLSTPETQLRRPVDRIGEIWVRGESIAQGYWNRPEATDETFCALLADTGEGPFLRTGDLGFVKDGELYVAGRLKDLVIIRGRNFYPHDIEWTVGKCHQALREGAGAALAIEVDGEERLLVCHELERAGKGLNVEEVVAAIRQAVALEHELDVFAIRLLRPLSIPKTSSGKVQRGACREAFKRRTLQVVGEWTQVREDVSTDVPANSNESRHSLPNSDQCVSPSSLGIADWLAAKIARPLGMKPAEVDRRQPFASFGVGSCKPWHSPASSNSGSVALLRRRLHMSIPTIEALARYLANEQADRQVISRVSTSRDDRTTEASRAGAIAIIGIGCRFPVPAGPNRSGSSCATGLMPSARFHPGAGGRSRRSKRFRRFRDSHRTGRIPE